MSKIPPPMAQAVSLRGVWSLCAMDESCLGPIRLEESGAPFHHVGLPLDSAALTVGMRVDGHTQQRAMGPDRVMVIEARQQGAFWWNRPMYSACFYFSDASLAAALGRDIAPWQHGLRTRLELHAPVVARMLRALHADAAAGHPHGTLPGDTLFTALAAQWVAPGQLSHGPLVATISDWRVRRALAYIHAQISDVLTLDGIARAAATSAFHLSRCFRTAVGCSIWQYVLRERARQAVYLMRSSTLSQADIAERSGFATYSSFVAAVKREYGCSPAAIRASLNMPRRGRA